MADETTNTAENTAETTAKPKPKRARKPAKPDINAPTPGYDGPTGNRYIMVNEPKTTKTDGQIPAIVRAMKSAGKRGFTAVEIAERVAGDIRTVQSPLRVVRYYVSEWRRRGLIRAV